MSPIIAGDMFWPTMTGSGVHQFGTENNKRIIGDWHATIFIKDPSLDRRGKHHKRRRKQSKKKTSIRKGTSRSRKARQLLRAKRALLVTLLIMNPKSRSQAQVKGREGRARLIAPARPPRLASLPVTDLIGRRLIGPTCQKGAQHLTVHATEVAPTSSIN